MAKASSVPGKSLARFLASVKPPLPLRPAARKVSSGSPACGTSFISIPRCVPTSTTSLSAPRESHSRAIAIAGKTWPPVPPPAISNFTDFATRSRGHGFQFALAVARSFRLCLLRNIQDHASCQQHDEQTRTAVADEGQRNAFRRDHAENDGEIDERLAQDHSGDSQCEKTAETVRRG